MARRGARAGEYLDYSRTIVFVSAAEDFSMARRGARAGEYLGYFAYDCFRFCRRGFLGGEPPLARQGAPAGKYLDYSCTIVSVSAAGVSTNARNDNVTY